MFEVTHNDEVAGVAYDAAQFSCKFGSHGERESSSLIFEDDETNAFGGRWALGRDGPIAARLYRDGLFSCIDC